MKGGGREGEGAREGGMEGGFVCVCKRERERECVCVSE
jgi:hypothetical protein